MGRPRAEIISEMVDSGLFSDDEIRSAAKGSTQPSQTPPEAKSPDLASTLYHGAIEGGAMTVGGAAGAVLGAPAGPVGSALGATGLAAAMYPPAKRFAEGIDRLRGITPPEQPSIGTEYGQGLAIEAGGAVIKKAAPLIGKLLPGAKSGEALSGTPANNLKRAYKQGFSETYLKPKPLAEAGENFGKEKLKLAGKYLTPEEQVAMTVNPNGEANRKLSEVMLKWMNKEPISPTEALSARQAIDTVFPPDIAKRQVQRGAMGQFREALNTMISEEAPSMAKASNEYAASKLRSQLLMPARVNKSNPEQFSKLGAMFNTLGAGIGYGTGNLPAAIGVTLGTSPLAMGVTSSLAGSVSRLVEGAPASVARRALITQFVENRIQEDNQ